MSGPSRRAGTTSSEQPAEPIQATLMVRLEDGGQLMTEWRATGAAGELRRALVRNLSAAVVEMNGRHAGGLERGQVAGEFRSVKLLLVDGGPEGETLGEWKISGCGPKFHKQVQWSATLAVVGVNAEYIEILRAVAGRVGPNGLNPSQSGGLCAHARRKALTDQAGWRGRVDPPRPPVVGPVPAACRKWHARHDQQVQGVRA